MNLRSALVRRTEAVITLVHPTDARQSRSRYFRHMFDQDSQDWGYPDSSANGFGTTEELKALGFLGAQGDVLRLDARVKVTLGKRTCTQGARWAPAQPRCAVPAPVVRRCARILQVVLLRHVRLVDVDDGHRPALPLRRRVQLRRV